MILFMEYLEIIKLYGGSAGADTIYGGTGNDTLSGGAR